MNYYSGRQGFIKGLLLLVLIVMLAYAGIEIGKPYYRYNTLRSHTKDLLQMELGNIEAIKKKIMESSRELNVPLDEKNLEVRIVNKIVKVKATWYEVVDFQGYYQKRIDFAMEVEY